MSDVPDGKHRARVVDSQLNYTLEGKERMTLSFELLDADGVEVSRYLAWHGYFTEKAMETTLRALRTCGWKGDDVSNLEGITDNEVELVVEHETYEGKSFPRVRWVNAPGGAGLGLKVMEPAIAKSFAAKMRAAVRAFDIQTGNGKRPPAPKSRVGAVLSPEPPPPVGYDDEIGM